MGLFDVGKFNWTDAKTACDELVLNGYTDWRLPSNEELKFIYNNAYKLGLKVGVSRASYWSSTPVNSSDVFAWDFDFNLEIATNKFKDEKNYVRAVRDF